MQAAVGILPIPGTALLLGWNVFRTYCHYSAYQGSTRLLEATQEEAPSLLHLEPDLPSDSPLGTGEQQPIHHHAAAAEAAGPNERGAGGQEGDLAVEGPIMNIMYARRHHMRSHPRHMTCANLLAVACCCVWCRPPTPSSSTCVCSYRPCLALERVMPVASRWEGVLSAEQIEHVAAIVQTPDFANAITQARKRILKRVGHSTLFTHNVSL